jgi:phosphatidylserine/phosphatidylglycerophosphate/cardiolipin synthase-like enzyme
VHTKSGVVALVAALVLTLAPSPAHAAFTPAPGPLFNNPWGKMAAKERLLTKVRKTIRSTPRGEKIRIAVYSNDRKDIADALINAHERGVRVQMLLNGHAVSRQTKRLQRRLGSDVSKRSFVRICKYSCRGKNGNLHSKFFLFTRAGEARHVVMFGSTNLMGYGAKVQWNDLHTEVNRKALHGFFLGIFNEMKHDRPVAEPFQRTSVGDFDINVYPRYDKAKERDRMLLNLKRIRCKGATGPSGIRNRTLILINMFGWNGERGAYLARKIAAHSRNGCVVRVINSRPGGKVTHILSSNGVQIKSPDYDRNDNGKIDVFTHAKYLAVSGNYARTPSWHVWTGSQNWSDRSLNGDEITVHVPRRGVFARYRKNFEFIWDNHSYWVAR